MKKILLALGLIIIGLSAHNAAFAATCTPVTSTYPGSLDTFQTGQCIPSAWANTLEQVIGATNSGVSSSIIYQLTHISGGSSTLITPGYGITTSPNPITGIGSVSVNTSTLTDFINSLGYATSTSNSTGTPTYYVAASNAPQYEKNNANIVCSGVDDGVCINNAINVVSSTFPNGAGTIQLSDGTFNVSTTIVNVKNFIGLNGDGPNNTIINVTSTAVYGIHFGNAQTSGNDTVDSISNLTVNGQSTSTTPIWIDGFGSGGFLDNVYTDANAKYGIIVEDADRVILNNVRASGGYIAALDFRVGRVNTFGKVLANNIEAGVESNNSVGVLFDADSDQVSPNAPGEVTFVTPHMQEDVSVSSGTCMQFDNGITALNIIGGGFEDCDTQIETKGTEVDGLIQTVNFINSLRNSQNIIDVPGYANITFDSDTFQQSINAFNGGAGFPNLTFDGSNLNLGSIAHLFTGSFASLQGNDVSFAGAGRLVSGLSADPYSDVYTDGLTVPTLTSQPCVGTDGSGNLQAGTCSGSSSSTTGNVNGILYVNPTITSSTDMGAYINSLYASAAQSITVWITASSTFSTPVIAGTNGKFLDVDCVPGVVLTYTGASSTYAFTWNDGTEFPKQAHESTGCSLKGNQFPSGSSPGGVYFGGTHGFRKGTLDGWSIWGFNIGLNWGTNSYNDTFSNGLIENNIQNVNFITYSNSGEDDVIMNSAIVDPANTTSSNCIVLQSSAVSTLTISGTSIDDCQLVIKDYSVIVNLINNHWENADTFDYGSPQYLIVLGHATTINAQGNTFQNDASTSTKSYISFYDLTQSDDTLVDFGDIFQGAGGYTLQDAISGTGKINLFGATNYVNQPGATYAYASTTLSAIDTTRSGFGANLATTTINGTASTSILCLGGTCNASWPNGISTSSAITIGYSPAWSSATGTLSGTSSLYTAPSGDGSIGSNVDNGQFSVTNPAALVALTVASTTNNPNKFQVVSGLTGSVYLGVTSSGLPLFLGTSTPVAIGGASLALDACTSTTTIVPFPLSTSSDIAYGTNPIVPLNQSIFQWTSYISQTGASTSTVTTQVCDSLAAGSTPTSTKYLFFVSRITGM